MKTQNHKNTTAEFPELNIQTAEGVAFEIPLEGSLGLLALGDIGLMAWRKKKMEFLQAQKKQET
ncbi:MAG: hypothetical protein AAF849_04050 [Bacteroidota bacterium]